MFTRRWITCKQTRSNLMCSDSPQTWHLSQTDLERYHRPSDQDSHILELTEKNISSTGFPPSTKEVSAASPRDLIKDPTTHFKNKYVTFCKGNCVVCAGNTRKLNTSYRTSCNLGAEKPSAGKGIKKLCQTHQKLLSAWQLLRNSSKRLFLSNFFHLVLLLSENKAKASDKFFYPENTWKAPRPQRWEKFRFFWNVEKQR